MKMRSISVGQKARRTKTITQKDVELFTVLTGDKQPIHYDEALAKQLGYKAPIVQGGVTTGLFNAIVAHDLPGTGSVFLNVNWNFRKPVYVGDTLIGEVEIVSVREDKPVITLKTSAVNQDGETVLDGSAVVYKRDIN